MNNKQLFLLFIGFLLLITSCKKETINNGNKADTLKIISASMSPGLIYGIYTRFTVTVYYNLTTNETATLMLGFNNGEDPGLSSATSATYVIINKGRGQYVYSILDIAKDWGSQANFSVYAYMATNPVPTSGWQPLANDTYILIPKH